MEIDRSKVFEIKKAKFYLPNYQTDCISNIMVSTMNYWDNWKVGALSIIDKYLPENAVIADIGANVGSHSIYWALERNVLKIYSFEPYPETFEVLKTNVMLNNLENTIEVSNFGLSDEFGSFVVEDYNPRNIGATVFKKSMSGNFYFCPFDDLKISEPIDMIKIDVEGGEVDVLNGMKKTMVKSHPIIVIETFNHKKEVDDYMHNFNYSQVETIREGEDYIYTYSG